MTQITLVCEVQFGRRARSRHIESDPAMAKAIGRTPRITRLMALAIRFEDLVREGKVTDYATLADLGHVSRARITQIMNLRLLAPDIQEEILFLPRTLCGRDAIHLRQLQRVALTPDWRRQRRLWRELVAAIRPAAT